jgi:hypothetical protein
MSVYAREQTMPDYYQKVGQRQPRNLFLQAVNLFSSPGLAVDLGCGASVETRELLGRGWQVGRPRSCRVRVFTGSSTFGATYIAYHAV